MAINNEIVKPKRKLSDVAKEVLAYCGTEQAVDDLKEAILSIGNPQLTIKILLQESQFKYKENRDSYSYYADKDMKKFYDPSIKNGLIILKNLLMFTKINITILKAQSIIWL